MHKDKRNLSVVLFTYGFVFTFFLIMPTFLPGNVHELLTWEAFVDFFTSLAVIPVSYLLYHRLKNLETEKKEPKKYKKNTAGVLFFIGFILFIDGHGIHLAANSIARYVKDVPGSEIYRAVYLFDEVISHFLWDGGVFLISLALIVSAVKTKQSPLNQLQSSLLLLGAVLYGFTFTVNGIEGQTVIFTFPAAGIGCALSFFLSLREKGENQVLLFFLLGYFLSLILFAYWGIAHGGFPEFSELGLI
jgi:hypothetical protein